MEHFNSAEFLISTFIGILSPNQLHSIIPIGAVSKPKVLYLANHVPTGQLKMYSFTTLHLFFQIEKSQGEIYRLRAKLESTQTENENIQVSFGQSFCSLGHISPKQLHPFWQHYLPNCCNILGNIFSLEQKRT